MDNEIVTRDLKKERTLLEGLLQTRFNFFILAYTLLIYSALTARTISQFYFTIWFGVALLILLTYPIFRIYVKVDHVLRVLHAGSDPAMRESQVGVKEHPCDLGQANRWLGYVIPLFCIGSLIAWSILTSCGLIHRF